MESGAVAPPNAVPIEDEVSMTNEERQDAIWLSKAWKTFGKGEKATQVLQDLYLTVKEGSIYTLLGSSGCGKTTLLSCIVGASKLDRGQCLLFGLKPGTRACGVPGKNVGYMPQEIALYREFTIQEAMSYFGTIHGMSSNQIEERLLFLVRFLNLPPGYRLIRTLSGGQQRRVSFAVALLHKPKILILDEPTVGVDPVLRKSIWIYLKDLAKNHKTTVLITTHYIEEANEANCIGLMRNGRLLAEDSPSNLMSFYACLRLEDVFFKLCSLDDDLGSVSSSEAPAKSSKIVNDTENASSADCVNESALKSDLNKENNMVALYNETNRQPLSPTLPQGVFNSSVEHLIEDSTSPPPKDEQPVIMLGISRQTSPIIRESAEENAENWFTAITDCKNRLKALLTKNVLCLCRNLGFLLFVFCLPALQSALFCIAIGGEPNHLPFGVVNYEVADTSECSYMKGCSVSNMSCNFLNSIPTKNLNLRVFRSEEDALYASHQGDIWGFITIPKNFSDAMIQQGLSNFGQDQDSFMGSHMKLSLDMTSQQIAFSIQRFFATSFEKFTSTLAAECGLNQTFNAPPAAFVNPIYGKAEANFREFMAPGIILSIIFFMSVALTGSAFITERKEGMLRRSIVSGVGAVEIIVAHMLTQYLIMMGQTLLVLAVMIFIFEVDVDGSTVLAILLTLCQGTCGMSFGFLISALCDEEKNAIQMALGSFYPNLLLSGVVWPLESMPPLLRTIVSCLPQTQACEAMRSIFSRGWGFTHDKVWPGFAISIGWSIVYWILAIIIVRRKKNY